MDKNPIIDFKEKLNKLLRELDDLQTRQSLVLIFDMLSQNQARIGPYEMNEAMFERFWRFCYSIVEKFQALEDYRNCASFIYYTQSYKMPGKRPVFLTYSYQSLPLVKQKDFWVRSLSNFMEDAATSAPDIPRSKIYIELYEKNKQSLDYIFKDKFAICKIMESVRRINGVGDGPDVMSKVNEMEMLPMIDTNVPNYILKKAFSQ